MPPRTGKQRVARPPPRRPTISTVRRHEPNPGSHGHCSAVPEAETVGWEDVSRRTHRPRTTPFFVPSPENYSYSVREKVRLKLRSRNFRRRASCPALAARKGALQFGWRYGGSPSEFESGAQAGQSTTRSRNRLKASQSAATYSWRWYELHESMPQNCLPCFSRWYL